jgi:hypothetical protein
LVAALALVAAIVAASAHAAPPPTLTRFLRTAAKLDNSEIASLEKGAVVTKQLPASDDAEIAAFGIVKVAGTLAKFEALAGDPRRYYAMEGVDRIGVFSNPPVPTDVDALAIPKDDIDALRTCKPGSCDVKLTDRALARIARVDWSAPNATAQATTICKEMISKLAANYRSGGMEALGTIVDKQESKSRAGEFNHLLGASPYLYEYIPAFQNYLKQYPSASYDDAKTTLYWSADSFSPKPVISVNACTLAHADNTVLLASQLLAATHFFNAGLDMCVAVPEESGPGLYLVDVYRVRIDPPTGMLAGPAMKRVKDGTEKGVEKRLSAVSARLK